MQRIKENNNKYITFIRCTNSCTIFTTIEDVQNSLHNKGFTLYECSIVYIRCRIHNKIKEHLLLTPGFNNKNTI